MGNGLGNLECQIIKILDFIKFVITRTKNINITSRNDPKYMNGLKVPKIPKVIASSTSDNNTHMVKISAGIES